MKFFDLHSHPVCKTLFNDYTPWDFIKASDRLLGSIIESQSNLEQIITDDNCNLVCMTLSPVETGILDQWLLYLAPLFTDALHRSKINSMINGSDDYQYLLAQEQKNLIIPPKPPGRLKKEIIVLKTFREYDPDDLTKLFVFFNIEGGHAFYNQGNKISSVDNILKDYTAFVSSKNHMVFYITPAHLTPNIFINHAYGNKILAKGKLLPRGDGITKDGERFLDEIVQTGVLIDVKHMSLVSRQKFYENKAWNKSPLLCSHTGLTGCSWHDKLNRNVVLHKIKESPKFVKVRYVKTKGVLKETYFNPCSINLYDEDIKNILQTGGLIGISMDVRILGGERNLLQNLKLNEKEFISPDEFKEWKNQNLVAPLKDSDYDFPYFNYSWGEEIDDRVWDEEDLQDQIEELNNLSKKDVEKIYNDIERIYNEFFPGRGVEHYIFRERNDEHLRYFINQFFHIVSVALQAVPKIDPWKHICIGSDFDGYIQAIDTCRNVTQLSNFGRQLIDKLPALAGEANIKLPRPPTDLVEDILYNNAYNLFKAHFQYK